VTDQLLARHENARHENARPEISGPENGRHEHTFCVSENIGPEIARILKTALA